MSDVDIGEIIMLIIVFGSGVGGFLWVALKDDDKE